MLSEKNAESTQKTNAKLDFWNLVRLSLLMSFGFFGRRRLIITEPYSITGILK